MNGIETSGARSLVVLMPDSEQALPLLPGAWHVQEPLSTQRDDTSQARDDHAFTGAAPQDWARPQRAVVAGSSLVR